MCWHFGDDGGVDDHDDDVTSPVGGIWTEL